MFLNDGDGGFVNVARALGVDSELDARGVAVADFDHDGGMDLVVAHNDGPPTLYLNDMAGRGNWLALTLEGAQIPSGMGSNRDAVGALVKVRRDGAVLVRLVEAGSGYASQVSNELHFGLGDWARVDGIEITWPSGTVQRIPGSEVAVNTRLTIREPTEP